MIKWTGWVTIASAFGGISVLLGAFGAHWMKSRFEPAMLNVFETGVRYQMYHALALFGLAFLATRIDSGYLTAAGYAFALGIALFSGSLYALVLTSNRSLGMVTPIGGVLLIAGWILLGVGTALATRS